MKRSTFIFAAIAICICLGTIHVQAQIPNIIIDNIPRNEITGFNCSQAKLCRELRLVSVSDRALIPKNFLYPVFEWTRPQNYQGVFMLQLRSAAAELTVATKQTSWQPDGKQFSPFLTGKEFTATVFMASDGITSKSPPVRILIAPAAIQEKIAYRLVQPLFNPVLPNSIKIFSFNQRNPFTLIEFSGGSCAGCHAYSNNTAFFNIKKLADRRLFIALQQGRRFQFYQKKIGEFTFFGNSPDGKYMLIAMNSFGFFVNKNTITEPFDYPYQRGDIYWFDLQKQTLNPLPGACDPNYVEDMPSFSPDGKYVVFSRYQPEVKHTNPPTAVIRAIDLFKVPFNHGQGGIPAPMKNASFNHQYQYFARYAPNGKWLSFCRGDGFKGIFARASSDIYLLSADEDHLIKLNLNRNGIMDSWHYWSNDSHWLIFSSNREANRLTAIYLVYIDEQGNDYPPVRLVSYPNMKVNTPQFISEDFKLEKIRDLNHFIAKTYQAAH
jgi:hypothetical protein